MLPHTILFHFNTDKFQCPKVWWTLLGLWSTMFLVVGSAVARLLSMFINSSAKKCSILHCTTVCSNCRHGTPLFNPVMISWTYMSHLKRVFSSLLGQQYPTFSPCCHLPWSISVPLNQSECIYPRNSHAQMILCAMLLCSIAHSIICTRLFSGKMHSDWFNGIEIPQGRWQHGEKVGYCYPSRLKKTLCKWDINVPLVTKGLTGTYCMALQITYHCHLQPTNIFSER